MQVNAFSPSSAFSLSGVSIASMGLFPFPSKQEGDVQQEREGASSDYLGLSGTIWDYWALSRTISDYLGNLGQYRTHSNNL